jgi:hypothetical protein
MRILRALAAFAIVTALTIPAVYWFAITIWPPVTSDGHPVMPIGQLGFAIVFSPIAGGVAGFILGRR